MKLEPAATPNTSADSLLIGFISGWIIVLVSYAVIFGIPGIFDRDSAWGQSLYLIPWIFLGASIAAFALRRKKRIALGIVLAAVSIIAIALLLAGAFFALLASGQGH